MSSTIQAGYLVAAILFVLGLKGLARPRTAVRGNLFGSLGMLLGVVVTLTNEAIVSWQILVAGLVVGTAVGVMLAIRVQMTSMPELVALFNGFGGAASVLVVGASSEEVLGTPAEDLTYLTAAAASAIIGAVTFSGSVVAFGKLRESIGSWSSAIAHPLNVVLTTVAVVIGIVFVTVPGWTWLVVLIGLGLVLGVTVVFPIGGADMPVVIALLNSLSGLAAASTGFAIDNSLLIIAGSLVGASGLVLTQVMCVAMNRTLVNVLFGSMASGGQAQDPHDVYDGKIRSTSPDDVALILDSANRVVIVPGYGMAVAQAQHAVRDLTRALETRGIEVVFAVHPVAGRMPGHMNVLLAEAEIDYAQLIEMDVVNPTFAETDVAIVIGANDVVNPIAREEGSPIAGMPILDVDAARIVIVIKRSLSPGFAGIPNPLFAATNTLMLFGDGKEAVVGINTALNQL
jgi:NAD(P) transhydrogenase subunit beta